MRIRHDWVEEVTAMVRTRNLVVLFAAALIISACSGSSPTQGPGATQGGGVPGGNPGGGDTSNGKVTFQVTGAITASGEWGFVPAASIFGGDQGASLSFSNSLEQNAGLFSIVVAQDGQVLVSYVGPEGQVPGAECTTSDWNMGTSEGSGKFDCTAALTITSTGATSTGGKITGSFTARK
ncbi:MAG: hypothetical protein ABIZ52_08595 [Candidatus Limnocylindrales bacterium]